MSTATAEVVAASRAVVIVIVAWTALGTNNSHCFVGHAVVGRLVNINQLINFGIRLLGVNRGQVPLHILALHSALLDKPGIILRRLLQGCCVTASVIRDHDQSHANSLVILLLQLSADDFEVADFAPADLDIAWSSDTEALALRLSLFGKLSKTRKNRRETIDLMFQNNEFSTGLLMLE